MEICGTTFLKRSLVDELRLRNLSVLSYHCSQLLHIQARFHLERKKFSHVSSIKKSSG